LALARRKYPGAGNSLDALCARYGIDASRRTKHGALLDAEILAEVYAELTGGRQAALVFGGGRRASDAATGALLALRPKPLLSALSEEELAAHAAFVAGLGAKAIWGLY
jgi:DNA polymerase-3 subunit epsilon